ncbi:hypothetical protein [Micromonospora sp. NBC_00858]|uniref:hypothetical protein n=1 Tax=Micromonospora sp. NBC_00858 TaxID=2975979 RepID=UPI00387057EA|nr:hypothetical protein OG990_14460 [Micromonospora sp. NBC_00858]
MGQLTGWECVVQGARVQFMLGQDDDPAMADNIDAHVYLADGTHRYATLMTPDAIGRVLRRWAETGEAGGGRYFWCSDLVIIPRPGIATMAEALEEMIRSGDGAVALGKVEGDSALPE